MNSWYYFRSLPVYLSLWSVSGYFIYLFILDFTAYRITMIHGYNRLVATEGHWQPVPCSDLK